MKITSFTCCLFLLFAFTACQKEISDPLATPPPPSPDSIYLDKVYIVEITPPGPDTVSRIIFSYDNQRRVTSMNIYSGIADEQSDLHSYQYQGNDTIPYITTYMFLDSYARDTTITYHFYDNMARNVKDSAIQARMHLPGGGSYSKTTVVTNYSYAPGKKFGVASFYYILPAPGYNRIDSRRDTALVDARGNITSNRASFYNITSGIYELKNTADLTFDNHINPFSLLSNFKAHQQSPSGETLYFEYFSPNNILSLHESNWGTLTSKVYNYTYRSDGLIAAADHIYTGSSTSQVRFIYTYRSF